MASRYVHAQISDSGKLRVTNQDAALSLRVSGGATVSEQDVNLFAVADGLGGAGDGEYAASLALRILMQEVLSELSLAPTMLPTDILVKAVRAANHAICDLSTPETFFSAGTTLTAALIIDEKAHIAHVGDSKAHLITPEGILRLTTLHDFLHKMIELGHITWEDAFNHPMKNVLYRALGQSEDLKVDTVSCDFPIGSWLMLSTDGLFDTYYLEKTGTDAARPIEEIIRENADLYTACEKLITWADSMNQLLDNITVLLVKRLA